MKSLQRAPRSAHQHQHRRTWTQARSRRLRPRADPALHPAHSKMAFDLPPARGSTRTAPESPRAQQLRIPARTKPPRQPRSTSASTRMRAGFRTRFARTPSPCRAPRARAPVMHLEDLVLVDGHGLHLRAITHVARHRDAVLPGHAQHRPAIVLLDAHDGLETAHWKKKKNSSGSFGGRLRVKMEPC